MSDIKLFKVDGTAVSKIQSTPAKLEQMLQILMEQNLETMLDVRFVATEYSTGEVHGGRIDTLGIDQNHSPVIIEYKRGSNSNVINQGLYYLNWLMNHQGEFTLLVMQMFGNQFANLVNWQNPRLICVSSRFNKFDGHAIQQMNRNIELYEYNYYGDNMLMLNLVHQSVSKVVNGKTPMMPQDKTVGNPGANAKKKAKGRTKSKSKAETKGKVEAKDRTERKSKTVVKDKAETKSKTAAKNNKTGGKSTTKSRAERKEKTGITNDSRANLKPEQRYRQ